MNEYLYKKKRKKNQGMHQNTNLTTEKCQEFFFCIKVLPFNTTWLFYKPRKISIYYDDSTVHIAVGGGISVTGELGKVYKIPFSKEFKVKSILPGLRKWW